MVHSETLSRFFEFVVKKLCKNPFDLELLLFSFKYRGVIGIDEAGVGAIFGPVVAAAVLVTPSHEVITGVADSKSLKPKVRATLNKLIQSQLTVGIGVTEPDEVNYVSNIEKAGDIARQRALKDLLNKTTGKYIVVSDHFSVDSELDSIGVTRGDTLIYSIGAASIVAKEVHDELINKIVNEHPEWAVYGLRTNKGYRTKEHLNALTTHGCTPYHRMFMREVSHAAQITSKSSE
ncbi:ribonuclease HII [Candidatus Bathyarchaeota archaeon]|nr:MAG: ribonuclease HII [Candidatus Bathyarchaeota archaeon]